MTGQQLQINPNNAIYASDEYGRPFIIVREQEKKQRMHGIEAQKVISFLVYFRHISWPLVQSLVF